MGNDRNNDQRMRASSKEREEEIKRSEGGLPDDRPRDAASGSNSRGRATERVRSSVDRRDFSQHGERAHR